MRKEYANLKRRTFLAPVWLLALAGFLGVAVAIWGVLAASTTLVVVVRHAEKNSEPGPDPTLSPAGIERAARLAAVFGSQGQEAAIDAIFVTQWQRAAATARPLAMRLGVPVIAVAADDLAGLEHRIFGEYRGRRVLVIGHNDSVPEIAARLARRPPLPPMAADDFGTVYVIAVPRWGRPLLWRLTLP